MIAYQLPPAPCPEPVEGFPFGCPNFLLPKPIALVINITQLVPVTVTETLFAKPLGENMKRCLCAVGLLLSLGCATAVVRPYVGDQQAWPVASGSIVNTKYDLPIFTSLPPVPYDVLAEIRISSPLYAQPEEGHMPRVVKRAREIKADALVFVQGKLFFAANYGPRGATPAETFTPPITTLTTVNTFNPDSFAPEVNILAIRWVGAPPPGLPTNKKIVAKVANPTNVGTALATPAPTSDTAGHAAAAPAEQPKPEPPEPEAPVSPPSSP